jgi:hypothetical protein
MNDFIVVSKSGESKLALAIAKTIAPRRWSP